MGQLHTWLRTAESPHRQRIECHETWYYLLNRQRTDRATHLPALTDIGSIGLVSVASSDNSTVYAGTVAVPGFERNLARGLTSGCVDHLDVENERNAGIAICDILANVFTRYP